MLSPFRRETTSGSRGELASRLAQQHAVARLAQLALTDIPAQGLLDEACRIVAAELRADLAGVLELLPDLSAFVLRAGVGWPPEQLGIQHVPAGPLSQGGYTLQSGGPVIIRDAANERRFELSPHMTAQGVTSGLSTSIGSNGGKYGVLGAHTYRRRDFSDHDVTFLDAVAGVLASALRRRTAEQKTEEAHRVLEAVIDGTADSVFVKDIDGRFIVANERAAQVLGRPPAELVGRTFHEVMPGAMADTVTERDRLILERGSVETFEEVVSVGDETRVYLSTKGPYRARDGTLLGTFGIVRDITVRKAQEQELAASEERFRLAQEGARMGTWDVDLVTGVSTWSEGLRKLCGVGPDYPSGFEHLTPLLHPDDREEVARWVAEAYSTGVDVEVECRIVLPDGELRWLLARSTTLRSVNGVPTRVLGVAVEITKRKRAEEELRAATAYADRLIETSNAIVLVLDAHANILTFNKAAEEITGYTREEVVGRNWDLLSPRDRYPAPWAYHGRLVTEEKPVERYENPILTKSGEERIVLWQNSQLRDQADEVVGTVSFGIDVTETVAAKEHSQALETRLRHAEKLEAVGKLAGGVAHDFNNVLLAIHGYAELALGRLARGEEGAAGDIEEVLASAERAAALTSQLLAFGRRQVLNPEVLDLNEVVRNVHGLLERVIGDNVELVIELAERAVVVKADRGQLEQVIANLAVNGRDAMPGGGRLTIRVASAELERPDANGVSRHALLSVIDEGSGIDAPTALLIFEPFFTTKGDKGSGLGLATAHGVITQSGGQIAVESEVGQGATFTITLPLADSAGALPEVVPVVATPSSRGAETILLVEDDVVVKTVVTMMLNQHGYHVITAGSGEQAIALARATPGTVDLLITDLLMPGLSGRETAEVVLIHQPQAKVLYMSGYTDDAVIRFGVFEPGISFIQKPFTGDALAGRVRELLDAEERTTASR